ncbi:RING-H2 finger protein ATL80 [Apostasia shenzhenica]|uniref:RING-type E3 ubiquitin transferase n=1 Tax=Apostasia shenzhenica TaxID=1088818 RepID=A0A2I0AA84_9ASPA|nr:RING-H2 finger protein ATL80 [Apostasia shenzhenica]
MASLSPPILPPPRPPANPPAGVQSKSSKLDYYYFVVGLALVAIVLLVTNAIAVGCCSWVRRFLGARGLLSGGELVNEEDLRRWIPTQKYRKREGQQEDGECPVCLSAFDDGDEVRLLPQCLHSFHVACIDMWLQSHSSCPVCRSSVVPTPYHSMEFSAAAGFHSRDNLMPIGFAGRSDVAVNARGDESFGNCGCMLELTVAHTSRTLLARSIAMARLAFIAGLVVTGWWR